jgi:adenine phosphoribosyltransferase
MNRDIVTDAHHPHGEPAGQSAPEAFEARVSALRDKVRDIPDFPKPGILFRDLTPLMGHGPSMRACCELLSLRVAGHRPDVIVAIESRGFIFGAPVAASLGVAFVPVRKPGKLPWKVDRRAYALEYGTDSLEMHADAVLPGKRVVIVDDLLATGGTAEATAALVRMQGGQVVAFSFVIELQALAGRQRLQDATVETLIVY